MSAAIAGLVGVIAVLLAHAAAASGRSLVHARSLTPDLATTTRTGMLTLARALCLALLALLAGRGSLWRRATWVVLVLSGAAMIVTTLAGHGWTAEQRTLAIASDVVHQVALGAWAGGAAALLVGLRVSEQRARLARRFSTMALGAASIVAVTGTISALIEVGSLEALTSTGYGQLVIAKVIGFGVLVTFGWLNRRHLVPLVQRAASPLIRSLRWEIAAASPILVITAVLVEQVPGRTSVARPFSATVVAEGATPQLTAKPARVGSNDLHLYFYAEPSGEVLPVDAVEVTAGTAGIPPRRLEVVSITASHVSVYEASFPTSGAWDLEVTLVRSGEPTTFTLEVPTR